MNSEGKSVREVTEQMRGIALAALERMFLRDRGLFAFRIRKTRNGLVLEGESRRYTAIALIGLAREPESDARRILGKASPEEICRRLLDEIGQTDDVGEVALALWAARMFGHPQAERARDRLKDLLVGQRPVPTVELAWSLTALTVPGGPGADPVFAARLASRLGTAFHEPSGLFAHWPTGESPTPWRSHVCCYADLVYPIQALSFHARAAEDGNSLRMARRCADQMGSLQGAEGQWWWHYDVRTGRVVEPYPVYSVHQHAMGPMALFDHHDLGGADHFAAVRRGVEWMVRPAELAFSLIDMPAGVIWRKVARREPGKLARSLQAAASRVHPRLRCPGLDRLLPVGTVDYESRPYEMGWLLYAWPKERVALLQEDLGGSWRRDCGQSGNCLASPFTL